MRYQKRLAKESFIKTPKFIIIAVVIASAGALAALELTNTTHIFHKKLASSTIPSKVSTDTEKEPETTPSQSPSPSPEPSAPPSDKTTAPPTSDSELLAPSGNFASTHRPSLKDSPGVESVCVTTPGAYCTITFTKDGIVKTLESQKSDSNGTVIWNWDVKSAGFVAGSWTITATATLNGQSRSTTDLQKFEVQP